MTSAWTVTSAWTDAPRAFADAAIAGGPAIAARGRDAGAALGGDPAAAVTEITARVLRFIDERDGSELLTTVVGGMRLIEYLPTRTFELAVHIANLAVADGSAGRLLLAATGRAGLLAGFSVV